MPEQLCNRAQIDPGHNKSTGKRMAVAMPRIIRHLCLFEDRRKPSPRALQGISCAQGREDRVRFRPLFLATQFLEGADCNGIQGNGVRIPVLRAQLVELPPLKIDLVPAQAVSGGFGGVEIHRVTCQRNPVRDRDSTAAERYSR